METIKVGKIVNTRGLRGEVKIVPNTHFIHERFGEGALLYLGEERCEVRVLRSRMEKGLVFAVFEGREDINRVESFKGADVYADKSDPLLLAEDEVLYSDLMDCDVYTSAGSSMCWRPVPMRCCECSGRQTACSSRSYTPSSLRWMSMKSVSSSKKWKVCYEDHRHYDLSGVL